MTLTISNPILSFPDVIRSKEPRAELENRLVLLLNRRLKEFKISWNPQAFKGGLQNPDLPIGLMRKLETLIIFAESVRWQLSKNLLKELDETIEDIETFNPSFRRALKRATDEIRSGRYITHEELTKKFSQK